MRNDKFCIKKISHVIGIGVIALNNLNFAHAAPICESTDLESKKQTSFETLSQSMDQISCFETRARYRCDLLEENDQETMKAKIIQCDQNSLKNNQWSDMNLFNCVWNGIKLSGDQIIDTAKLPLIIAEAAIKGFRETQDCNNNLEKKRLLLNAFNSSISDPRFKLEEKTLGQSFNQMACSEIDKLLQARYQNYTNIITSELFAAKITNKPYQLPAEFKTENCELTQEIENVFKLAKINYQCFTPKVKAEMICTTVTNLLADAAITLGVKKAVTALREMTSYNRLTETSNVIPLSSEDVNALRTNKMREDSISKEYQNILVKWKADSPKAKELANELARKQMNDMGMKNLSFIVDEVNLPKPNVFSEVALKNPKMADYIKRMKERGYQLVIDPPIGVESDYKIIRGRFSPNSSSIRILPTTTWDVFEHEFQHLIYHDLGLQSHYLKTTSLTTAEETIIKKSKNLLQKGYSNLTVNETLAVEAEVKSLYKMGYTPWSQPVYEARKYAWGFQEKDIAAGIVNNTSEAVKIKFKRIALNPSVVRTALGLGTLEQIYFNEKNDEVLVIDKSGNAKKYNIEELKTKK